MERSCPVCGLSFTARSTVKLYCSTLCKDRGKPSARWQGRENVQPGGHGQGGYKRGCRCEVCRASKNAKQREFARRRFEMTGEWQRGRWIKTSDRLALYERDRWTCQICGEPVNRTPWSHDPRDPTLDHIVPRSRGGTHEASNLRTACFLCNALRGDRVGVVTHVGKEATSNGRAG